uniref:Poly(A) polymerase catalytic subunit domain-containing protein n=1 Tax=viral metagenome TaxID=1070528 RepID=A0A6C0JJG2_9ZZZZ
MKHNTLHRKKRESYKTKRQRLENVAIQTHPEKKTKFHNEHCDNKMTFEECEMAILRHAIEETEKLKGETAVNSPEIKKMLVIVEDFIIHKKLVCYGGTAINNILPKYAQFYNRDLEIPDYDFFSSDALNDAKELADIYYAAGYKDVEAKAGVHMGTFKVFVNFIPIADITMMHKELYDSISKESILIAGVHYAPPDYLRMAMYLELSRPAGDVSRWEKVLKRLNLLNEHYPLNLGKRCDKIDFHSSEHTTDERLHFLIRDSLIDQGAIFFGAYAMTLYKNALHESGEKQESVPDFDVVIENPEKCALIIKEHLEREKFKGIRTVNHEAIGEIIPEHIELCVGKESVAFIYKPIACHNYNKIVRGNQEINIASIDTIMTFYLSFMYADMPYYNKDRLGCMAKFLFDIQQKNRLEQRGILKRFSIDCYGKQPTLEDMRAEKAEKYKELKDDRDGKEYEMWFLKYVPDRVQHRSPYAKEVSIKIKKELASIDKEASNQEVALDQNKPLIQDLQNVQKTILRHKQRKTHKKKRVTFMDMFREKKNRTRNTSRYQ